MENRKLTPQFFFVSLGVLIALSTSVTAFIKLAFETFNHALPDVLTDSYQYGYVTYSYEGIRSALALLIIVFPIYLALEYVWLRLAKQTLSYWDDLVQRWVTYLILFLASVTVIADLVVLVQYFVSGEITERFLYKVLTVLIVASMVGVYYIRKLLGKEAHRIFFAIKAAALALALIVWSFTVIGGPVSQRNLRLDQRRINDLQSLQWQIISYWQQREKLPESFADLSDPLSGYSMPRDPEFQKGFVYEYEKRGPLTFALCGTFALPMPQGYVPGGDRIGIAYPSTRSAVEPAMPIPGGDLNVWDHDAGRKCFERTIDPEIYSPLPREKR